MGYLKMKREDFLKFIPSFWGISNELWSLPALTHSQKSQLGGIGTDIDTTEST